MHCGMKRFNFVVALASLALSFNALAETEPTPPLAPVGTSSQSDSLGAKGILERIGVSYFGVFHGPTVSDLSSPYSVGPNVVVSQRNAINFDSELTVAYKLTSDLSVGPVVPFLLVPVLGQGIIMGDAGVKISQHDTVNTGGLKISTNLILQAPTSGGSEARNMKYAVKSTPSIQYRAAGSRFTLGAWTEAKWYAGVSVDKTFKLYGQPYVSYRISPSLAAVVGFEAEAHHNVGQQGVQFSNYQSDFLPGLLWNVSKSVAVNPYVQLFTGNGTRVNADSMALGAVINATIL